MCYMGSRLALPRHQGSFPGLQVFVKGILSRQDFAIDFINSMISKVESANIGRKLTFSRSVDNGSPRDMTISNQQIKTVLFG